MIGSHIVREFRLKTEGEVLLPEGWKPFAYNPITLSVICRKWVRSESAQGFRAEKEPHADTR